MTPLDDDIRALLAERARTVGAPDNAYAAATARGRWLRRRRRTAWAGALAAVTAAVAVPLLLVGGGSGPARVQVVAPPSTSPTQPASASAPAPAASASGRASASASAGAAQGARPTAADASSWPFRGDQATRTALVPGAYAAARVAGVTPELSLWAGTTPNGGWSGLLFRGRDSAGRLRLLTWLSSGGGTVALVRNDPLPDATVEIDQQLPSDPANALVVLGPPAESSGPTTISYAGDGGTPAAVDATDGVAMVGLSARGDAGAPRIRITQASRVVYDGPPTGGALPALW